MKTRLNDYFKKIKASFLVSGGVSRPMISVIVPVYNSKPYLTDALDSVKDALSGITSEVICVDDGSDDGSGEVLDDYVANNLGFYVFHTENAGAAAARNFALKKARGKYLAFVDSDDKLPKNIYKDMLYICEANGLNLCICNVTRLEGENKGVVSVQYQRAFDSEPKLITTLEESMSFIYDGASCNKLIRRDFWNSHGFYYPEVGHYEDMPLFLQLFCEVDKFAVLHSFGYYWRITPGGTSISQQVRSLQTLKDRMKVCADMLHCLQDKYGVDSPPAKFMINRLICWEFDSNLWHFEALDDEMRYAFCDELRNYFREIIPEEILHDIPLFHKRRYDLIMNRDVDQLTRLMNHRRIAWRSTPIIEKNGHHYLVLPDDIYGQELADASVELQDDLPLTRVTALKQNGAQLKADVVVYQPRVNIAQPDSQDIKAFLYNEHTGRRIYLKCEHFKTEAWTRSYGEVICQDDYRVYNYNYDWAGITISMDFEDILAQDDMSMEILDNEIGVKPRWLIYIEYKTPVLKGVRPIRGILPKVQKIIPEIDITLEKEGKKYKYDFVQSIRETLYIEVNKL